jgi:hypothetical protein
VLLLDRIHTLDYSSQTFPVALLGSVRLAGAVLGKPVDFTKSDVTTDREAPVDCAGLVGSYEGVTQTKGEIVKLIISFTRLSVIISNQSIALDAWFEGAVSYSRSPTSGSYG